MIKIAFYLEEKRDEIIWALISQGYSASDIAKMFMKLDRFKVARIAKNAPKDYQPKWTKVRE